MKSPQDKSGIFDILPVEQAAAHRTLKGTTLIWRPARGVLVTRVEGALTDEAGTALEATIKRIVVEDGTYSSFNDWEEMTDYTISTRIRLTQAVYDSRKATLGVHFIVRSKIVAFGVQTANLVLKNLTVHPSRASFEHALRETMRKIQARK